MKKAWFNAIAGTVAAWVAAAAVTSAPAATPTLNGLFYGDGDSNNYYLYSEAPGLGAVYYRQANNRLYFAVVVSSNINDNVYGDRTADDAYLASALWRNKHWWKDLELSDHIELRLTIGSQTWNWWQDYLYDANHNSSVTEKDWLSDYLGNDGSGTPPAGLQSASSMQWNMNNGGWDVTLNGNRTSDKTYRSPDDVVWPPSDNTVLNNGWPTYDAVHRYEWAMVYEMSVDVSAYAGQAFQLTVLSAHNSPAKGSTNSVVILPPQYDFGDAPDTYGTTLASNGARHKLVIGGPQLGAALDADADGSPSVNADGDDVLDGTDDEDGVVFLTALTPGGQAQVQVTGTAGAKLDAWVDFNNNGVFDAAEKIANSVALSGAAQVIAFAVPANAAVNTAFYARFRVSSAGSLSPTGLANDGEVEDYRVTARLGDRVWLDGNNVTRNGIQDANEIGLANVTVRLYSGATLVGTRTTDSNGNYLFDGLPAGTYDLQFVAPATDYSVTLQDQGSNDAIDSDINTNGWIHGIVLGPTTADLTRDAGYYLTPTLVVISDFGAAIRDGQVVLQWQTSEELGTIGFWIQRLDPATGAYQTVNAELLPAAIWADASQDYELVDPAVRPGETHTYRVIELDLMGHRNAYGPFTVMAGTAQDAYDAWIGSVVVVSSPDQAANLAADADPDGDGMSNRAEYLAGTDPFDAKSALRLNLTENDGGLLLSWTSVAGKQYALEQGHEVGGCFSVVASGLMATPPTNTLQLPLGEASKGMFRIAVSK